MLKKLKQWARELKQKLVLLHLCYSDRRTPITAKVLIFLVLAYALSPIDLIPDFIPIIGYLDDLLILPLGIYFALRLIPQQVIDDNKVKAIEYHWNTRKNWVVGAIILAIWLLIVSLITIKIIRHYD